MSEQPLEPADSDDVDQQQHHTESGPHVAEDLERDVPLSVPLERVALVGVG